MFPSLRLVPLFSVVLTATGFAGVSVPDQVIVSVKEQKLLLVQEGKRVATFKVSTSKFGLGDAPGSMATPLGLLRVARKIGDGAPEGAVFHHRRWTGEVLRPNAPGRDPITTRIIWLSGLQPGNARAFSRCIYIHGTPEEKRLGKPASYGCIRMKGRDVASLYRHLAVGALVQITPEELPRLPKGKPRLVPGNTPERMGEPMEERTKSPFHNNLAAHGSDDRGA
jgi:hypothetical protein